MNCGFPTAKFTLAGSVGTKSVFNATAGGDFVSVAAAGTLVAQAETIRATKRSIAKILFIILLFNRVDLILQVVHRN